jgi:hypothetical protein
MVARAVLLREASEADVLLSARIALLWSESRLRAFLSGIALHPHAICPAEYITRQPDNGSGRKYKSELKGEGVPWEHTKSRNVPLSPKTGQYPACEIGEREKIYRRGATIGGQSVR